MTDKQIIIDGVDISGCEYCLKMSKYRCTIQRDVYKCLCEENPNCNYKNWKRKEQECERLKNDYQNQLKNTNKWIVECENLQQQLDQLKAENEELKKEVMKKDEVNTFFNTQIEGWSNDPCEICKYKQTITEIKPALELYANSKIGEEQLNGTYKIIVEDSKVLGDVYITFDPRPAKQALQKISECEVENAVVSSYYDKSERKQVNG